MRVKFKFVKKNGFLNPGLRALNRLLRNNLIVLLAVGQISGFLSGCGRQESHAVVGNYEIIGGNSKVEIPFEMFGMNIMVKAKMNDVDIRLLIDNGVMWDELWFYGNDQVDSIGFIYDQHEAQISGAGEGDGVSSVFAGCPAIHFPGIIFREQQALVSPPEEGFYKLFPGVAGQICGTLLRNFITEFDFDNRRLTLNKKESFNPEKYPCQIRMTPDSMGSYLIPVTIKSGNRIVKHELYIDLGGIYPVSLITDDKFQLSGDDEKTLLGHGASGPIYGYEGTLDYLKIGEYTLNDLRAVFTEDESGGDHTNQTIGLPLLMHFNIAFDYFDNVLYLAPNNNFTATSP